MTCAAAWLETGGHDRPVRKQVGYEVRYAFAAEYMNRERGRNCDDDTCVRREKQRGEV